MLEMKKYLKKFMESHSEYAFDFYLGEWQTDFLRFFNSQTNYNITKKTLALDVTVEKDKKKYSFSLSNPSQGDVEKALNEGLALLPSLPADSDFPGFEDNAELFAYKEMTSSLEQVPAEDKINILTELAKMADHYDFGIYGTFITLYKKGYKMNSTGLDKEVFVSPVMLDVKGVSRKNMVTVIHSYGGNDLSHFDLSSFSKALEEKIKKATLNIVDVDPGDYTVILGPHAAGELLRYLMFGAYADALDQGSSYFKGKLNEKVFPENFSVISDPLHPQLITIPYNEDGHIAKKLPLIDNGIFKNFIVNNYFAHKLNMEKNGSVGLGAMVLDKGTKSLEEMIKSIDRGLYISNIHYMNFINQQETSVTGLTRDGTFLIENGEITKVVNNLRFTEKLAEIFKHTVALENIQHTVPVSQNYGNFNIFNSLIPHVKTSKFKITSSTKTI
jgi:predicted Zn-dependent protease